jgi:hypothetical protein
VWPRISRVNAPKDVRAIEFVGDGHFGNYSSLRPRRTFQQAGVVFMDQRARWWRAKRSSGIAATMQFPKAAS